MLIADPGRYRTDPLFQAQAHRLNARLEQAVLWYKEGKLKPFITREVPLDATSLQKALDDFLAGKINVGKVVVRCAP